MNRRGFLGALAAAPAALPAVANGVANDAVSIGGGNVAKLGLAVDTSALDMAVGHAREIVAVAGQIRPFDFGSRREYVYRTGYPEIDALRSVSGVHKKRMESRHI